MTFKESEKLIRVGATIYVSSESQKGIVIGRQGGALKRVGTRARAQMERFWGKQVYLETRVKVRKDWRQDEEALREFGYF